MKVSLNLLNQYVKVDDIEANELAKLITAAGFEVEGIEQLAYGTNLVVGFIHECCMHPDSDHLHICQVEVKPGEILQIVCGAPNVASGQKVIVALPGCELTEGFKIKKSVIRGVESNGMICSLSELGIDQRYQSEEQKAGIEILDESAPIGQEALSYLGLKDTILDIGLTPNRADCMSIRAFAYEVAAILNREVHFPQNRFNSELKSDLTVETRTDKCSYFSVQLVKGVKTKQSPQWLKSILMASGIKPINNIVDISNYVMLEFAQPIHMYDYNKLESKEFVVDTGYNLSTILLDGQEYQIESEDIIVGVNDKVACVAGVMGSNSTKIDDNSIDIVVEVAGFNGTSLRKTTRRLNLLTDASSRYIKGANDIAKSQAVLERTISLLVELADASEIYSPVSTQLNVEQKIVSLRENRVNELLGTAISVDDIKEIFNRLKFDYQYNNGKFEVKVPTHRKDITLEADLVEEVARLYGYDHIPSKLPIMTTTAGIRNQQQKRERMIKDKLSELGLHEVVTYTLVSPTLATMYNYFHNNEVVSLMSPLGEERSTTRQSIVPSLLETIHYNQSHSNKDVNIFEIAKTYSNQKEVKNLAIACSGVYSCNKWQKEIKEIDFYVVKGFVENIFKQIGIEESRYQLVRIENDSKLLHPGRSAYIIMNKEIVGYIGQIHPIVQKQFDINPTYVAELNLSVLLQLKTKKIKFENIAQYPSVSRDIALVVDVNINAYDIERTIKRSSQKMVKNVTVFDVYQGEHVQEGKKSLAFNLIFQDEKKTLSEKEVNDCLSRILSALEKDYNAILRA